MKKLIFVSISLIFLFTLSGCEENLPTVEIHYGGWTSYITIDIGMPYMYKDFDIEKTDEGKDLILHFVKENKE